jgi:hypothetical protein
VSAWCLGDSAARCGVACGGSSRLLRHGPCVFKLCRPHAATPTHPTDRKTVV